LHLCCFKLSNGSLESLPIGGKEQQMRFLKAVLLAAVLAAATAPGIADARGGHGGGHFGGFRGGGFGLGVGLGLAIGVPFFAASYYAPPYYAPPYPYAPDYGYAPAYAAPQQYSQPAYPRPAPVQQASNSWYFCPSSNGYYPYVRECPGGWQQVAPQPPGR
jgi:hypothetical protein